ncbi:MAG TPA: ABC transporter permease, partial [Clostridiales bacterium]|nr:ABC transporter permease [Clostridiales bacterium]
MTYLKLEFKRSITILPTIIGSMVFMLLFIVGISVLISNYIYKSNLFEPITVGIVIPEDEKQGESIARLISTIESVNKTSEFEYMSELEARSKIENKELEVAILLDHEFFETVYAGYNAPAKILISEESSLNSEVFIELLNAAESIIRTTEAGAYSIADMKTYYEVESSWSDIASTFFLQYMEIAL